MPELPEVETVRRGLNDLIVGQEIKDIWIGWHKSFPNDLIQVKNYVIQATIVKVRRRAKVLMIDLDTNYTLVIHLKMTGQLVYRGKNFIFGAGHPTDSLINDLPDKSTRVTISLDSGNLYFNDQRKFGWIKLFPTLEVPNIDFMKKVGPEPLGEEFTPKVLEARLQKRKNSLIKAALLDQTVLAGLGNIYVDEVLFASKIHPETRVRDITYNQIKLLYKNIRNILTLSIEKGGSTDRNYVDAEGKRGSYLNFAKVFRREGQPCLVCGTEIIKTRVAGRGTHICPYCQKIPHD